jgi:hypothetical protein
LFSSIPTLQLFDSWKALDKEIALGGTSTSPIHGFHGYRAVFFLPPLISVEINGQIG